MYKNTHTDVYWYIYHWDYGFIDYSNKNLFIYNDGRINHHGFDQSFDGHIFIHKDPSYTESLEIGIRSLVVILNKKFNWITYNSCQWHKNARKRIIGILPRNDVEYQYIKGYMEHMIYIVNRSFHKYLGKVSIVENQLFDNKTWTYVTVLDIEIDSYMFFTIGLYWLHKYILDQFTKKMIILLLYFPPK